MQLHDVNQNLSSGYSEEALTGHTLPPENIWAGTPISTSEVGSYSSQLQHIGTIAPARVPDACTGLILHRLANNVTQVVIFVRLQHQHTSAPQGSDYACLSAFAAQPKANNSALRLQLDSNKKPVTTVAEVVRVRLMALESRLSQSGRCSAHADAYSCRNETAHTRQQDAHARTV